ncbi:MAG: response regulator [Gammaproteobacteria bacterium]|nr:response regulator [Gammaproteobacteria bacterium]
MQILLVEDDLSLAEGLQKGLGREGFAVNHVSSGADAIHAVDTNTPDIMTLDLGLPDLDGLDVLRQVRKKYPDLPVRLLTARDALEDKVAGLDMGADDYLVKPFAMQELLARLRVLERRISTVTSSEIKIGDICLDTVTHGVVINGTSVELSRREYMLLKALMENAGRIQTRENLESRLYGWGEEVASNAIEVHIHHLRKKLVPDFIKTVRGVGYTVKKA